MWDERLQAAVKLFLVCWLCVLFFGIVVPSTDYVDAVTPYYSQVKTQKVKNEAKFVAV